MLRAASVRCRAPPMACTRLLSTAGPNGSDKPVSGVSKPIRSILTDLDTDLQGQGSTGWLQQRLKEDNSTAKTRRSARPFKVHNAGTAGTPNDSTSGFVKIDKTSTSAKAAKEEGIESETTLTPKTLLEKLKWEQSGERLQRLRARAKDRDLDGWQRRKIEWRIKKVEEEGDEAWGPTKKLATSSMEKIRLLNAEFPNEWTVRKLSDQFHVSQEAIRRIIKSKFRPTEERTKKRETKRREQMEQYRRDGSRHERDQAGSRPD